jgi:hypothetical protein
VGGDGAVGDRLQRVETVYRTLRRSLEQPPESSADDDPHDGR